MLALLVFSFHAGLCQTEVAQSRMNVQYGISAKLTLELAFISNETHPILHLGISGGVGSNFITTEIHPTFNAEFQFYNRVDEL